MDEEDLYQNPIFSSMVTHLPDFERRACEENWLVLIPQLLSLEQLDLDAIDLSFLQKHILKPSPYLKDEFISEDGARRIVLSNGKLFHCGAGDDQEGVAVLFDEVFYSDLGSYTAYCIEKPMLQLKKRRVSSRISKPLPRLIHDESHPLLSEHEGRTVAEWMYILNKDAGNGRALRHLETAAEVITGHYVFVLNKVGIQDLMAKVSQSVTESFDILCKNNALFQHALSNNRSKTILLRALEAYLMTGIHDAVFPTLVELYTGVMTSGIHKSDANENERQREEEVSVHPLLRRWEQSRCPLGRLEGLKAYVVDDGAMSSGMSADDLLSFLVAQLEQLDNARPVIHANVRYMKDFLLFRPENELDFLLTQLEASIQYLWGDQKRTTEVSLKPLLRIPESTNRREISSRSEDSTEDGRTSHSRPFPQASKRKHKRKEQKRAKKGWGKFLERLQNNTADVVASSFSIR